MLPTGVCKSCGPAVNSSTLMWWWVQTWKPEREVPGAAVANDKGHLWCDVSKVHPKVGQWYERLNILFSQRELSDSLACTGTRGKWLRAFTPSAYEENEYLVLQSETVWFTVRKWLCEQKGTEVAGYKAEDEQVDPWLGQDPSVLYPISLFSSD